MDAFQSLLWWNTSNEIKELIRLIARFVFQSLLWWNTSNESPVRPAIGCRCYCFNPCCGGIPLMSGLGVVAGKVQRGVSILVVVEYL